MPNTETKPKNSHENSGLSIPSAVTQSSTQWIEFSSREDNLHYQNVVDVDPIEVSQKKETLCLIDVRQTEELHGDLGHIPGIQHLVLDQIPDHFDKIPKDKTIVFVCRSGGRSARAAAYALSQGLTSVYNMKGGMILWNELHLPTKA